MAHAGDDEEEDDATATFVDFDDDDDDDDDAGTLDADAEEPEWQLRERAANQAVDELSTVLKRTMTDCPQTATKRSAIRAVVGWFRSHPDEEVFARGFTAVSYTHLTLPTNREV